MALFNLAVAPADGQRNVHDPHSEPGDKLPRIIDGTGSISKGFNAIHYIENRNNGEIVFRNTQEP